MSFAIRALGSSLNPLTTTPVSSCDMVNLHNGQPCCGTSQDANRASMPVCPKPPYATATPPHSTAIPMSRFQAQLMAEMQEKELARRAEFIASMVIPMQPFTRPDPVEFCPLQLPPYVLPPKK